MKRLNSLEEIAKLSAPSIREGLTSLWTEVTGLYAPTAASDYGELIIIEAEDDLTNAIRQGCFPLMTNMDTFSAEQFLDKAEWINQHAGFYEIAFLTSDAGHFQIVILPDDLKGHAEFLKTCEFRCCQ